MKKNAANTSTDDTPKFEWAKFLGETGALVAIVGVWLYLAGWRYGSGYFSVFGSGLENLELPQEYYLIYGVFVVNTYRYEIISFIIIAIILFLYMSKKDLSRKIVTTRQTVPLFLIVGGVLVVLASGYWAGGKAAKIRISTLLTTDYSDMRRVQVWMQKTWAEGNSDRIHLAKELDGSLSDDKIGCYRLIYASKSKLLVFRPRRDQKGSTPPILELPQAKVDAIKLHAINKSCE